MVFPIILHRNDNYLHLSIRRNSFSSDKDYIIKQAEIFSNQYE